MLARAALLAALLATLVGLVVLGYGADGTSPMVFFGVESDYAAFYEGRTLMLLATPLLLVASGVFGWEGRWTSAALVVTPAVVCTTVAVVSGPGSNAFPFLLFLPLAPIAFLAALVAAIRGPASG